MSLFLVGALYSLAFGMMLSSVMVVAFEVCEREGGGIGTKRDSSSMRGCDDLSRKKNATSWLPSPRIKGYTTGNWFHIAYAPTVHAAASLVVRAWS